MGFLEKSLAFVMLPLSILIILEGIGIYSLSLPVNKVLIGAILMIALQVSNLIFLKISNGTLTVMNVVTGIVFILPAAAYLFSYFFGYNLYESLPLIVGVMMFIEALYTLH